MKPVTGSTSSFNYITLPEKPRESVKTKTTEIKILVKQTALDSHYSGILHNVL
jgi:hypothetical protein